MIRDAHTLAGRIREIHAAIRDEVVAACERNATDTMARVVSEGLGDTVFEIDRVSETMLIERFEELAREVFRAHRRRTKLSRRNGAASGH